MLEVTTWYWGELDPDYYYDEILLENLSGFKTGEV